MSRLALLIGLLLAAFVALPAAVAGPRKPKVLIVHSTFPNDQNDIRNKLLATSLFQTVDVFNAGSATPTIGLLRGYDAALLVNNDPWADRVALGNVMKQFVDEGYGVVQSLFTVAGASTGTLGGTWTPDYNCITFDTIATGSAGLGAIAQPTHPIMNGVTAFGGGSGSFRPSGTAITAGASLVASWNDGKPLVAVGPKINRADLGFYPASSDVDGSYWASNTDGVKLIANALVSVIRPKVLTIHVYNCSFCASDVQTKLKATAQFSVVDVIEAGTTTPTLAQLQQYDAVLVTSDGPWGDRDAMGNVLAEYTDWGGGVVLTSFTTGGGSDLDLGGRFSGDYQIIGSASILTNSSSLGTIAYSEHPIVAGVTTLSASNAYRTNQTGVGANGLIIARWSDNTILAAISLTRRNRVDLGMFPPSSAGLTGAWTPSGDGARLMANALTYSIKPYVGIATSYADPVGPNTRTRLLASRRFSGVTLLPPLTGGTPSLTTLLPFGSIFCAGDASFNDAVLFGNNLANYVDAGGSVVAAVFSVNGSIQTSRPGGRWITEGYDITPEGSTGLALATLANLGAFIGPAHPVQQFVRRFDGGTNASRQSNNPLLRGRRLIEWTDGKMLASVHNFRRRVDLGFKPASGVENASSWQVRTDGTTMIANALDFAAFMKPCPGDLNGDGLVDDTDFVLFAGFYNELIDPRGDLTGDNNTDDADFVKFAASYNALLCP